MLAPSQCLPSALWKIVFKCLLGLKNINRDLARFLNFICSSGLLVNIKHQFCVQTTSPLPAQDDAGWNFHESQGKVNQHYVSNVTASKSSQKKLLSQVPSFYIGHCPHIHQYAMSNQRSYSKNRKIHFALMINSLQNIFSKLLLIACSPLRTQIPSNKNRLLLPIGKVAPYVFIGAITALVSRCRGYDFGKKSPKTSGSTW